MFMWFKRKIIIWFKLYNSMAGWLLFYFDFITNKSGLKLILINIKTKIDMVLFQK